MNKNIIGVNIDGEKTTHAAPHGYGNYDTLCGIDADDSEVGHHGFIPGPHESINCVACKHIWRGTLGLKLHASDFSVPAELA